MKRKNREAIAGKNIIVNRLYHRFVTAKAIAGLADHDYTLKDLRPKGITDEVTATSKASNKGLHSPQMQKEHLKRVVQEEVTNNLARIRWEK